MPNTTPAGDSRGFIQYQLTEDFDRGSNAAESANVSFAIINRTIPVAAQNSFVTETALARYRGMYKYK